jgi:hypothetical protein
MTTCPYGYRIVGATTELRRVVIHAAAFGAYCSCDDLADVASEAYLSAFTFGDDFRALLESTGSCRGFDGDCWAPWLWFDIDRENDLDAARRDAARLALALVERYRLEDNALLLFFSGSKGFHVGLPASLWTPDPSPTFHRAGRRLAEALAGLARVPIDVGVYDCVRAFRAPNSRHPKTGLFKRRLSLDELTGLSLDGILRLAAAPAPFDLPDPPPANEQARADWQQASQAVRVEGQSRDCQRADGSPLTVNRQTFDFIRHGAEQGDRHRLLYSAARNLAEVGCSLPALHALLTESARDSGLSPRDTFRQIECGWKDGVRPSTLTTSTPADLTPSTPITSTATPSTPTPDLRDRLAGLWGTPSTSTKNAENGQVVEGHGDSWEHEKDQLGVVNPAALDFPFGANAEGGK